MSQTLEKRRFTPADDVALSVFEFPFSKGIELAFSPDGQYFMALTQRGLLAQKLPEDTIWIFRTDDVLSWLHQGSVSRPPVPLPLVRMATYKDEPIIRLVRWTGDSKALLFLAVTNSKTNRFHQLFRADLRTQIVEPLSPADEDVTDYDFQKDNYIYDVAAPTLLNPSIEDQQGPIALGGRDLYGIVFPPESRPSFFDKAGLWAVINGKRFQVKDAGTYQPLLGTSQLALSPDSRQAVALLATEHRPDSWSEYKAPAVYQKDHLPVDAHAYHLINLQSGTKKLLINAPSGRNQDWNSNFFRARWSDDGQTLLLSNTFLPLDGVDAAERARRVDHPCMAVLRLRNAELSCVLPIKAGFDKERFAVADARFDRDKTVIVDFDRSYYMTEGPPSAVFVQNITGAWSLVPRDRDPQVSTRPFDVSVRHNVQDPPVILAHLKDSLEQKTLWDPNPQLADVELGKAEVIHWKDDTGYEWTAGLVLPPDYTPGTRYPLVIQTHGFPSRNFLSSGAFNSSTFAAQALAAHGIVVLQMDWRFETIATPQEGPVAVASYESAIKHLTDQGLIDPKRVGAIGFSRTVYHVLEYLTRSKTPLAAASVSDGTTFSYVDYVSTSSVRKEAEMIYGGSPFKSRALTNWLAEDPGFNMDKVTAPLLVLALGPLSAMADWGPYAALTILNKPADLIMLPAGTHVISNAKERFDSETIQVDWYRFWLQGQEDSAPEKVDQYIRWRRLRALQGSSN